MKYHVLDRKESKEYLENGTSYRAIIKIPYKDLKAKLGYETNDDDIDGKVDTEWVILFENGMVGTIYNWYGSNLKDEWHIGGHSDNVVDLVYGIFDKLPPRNCDRINYKQLVGYTNRPTQVYSGKLMSVFKEEIKNGL